MTSSRKLNMVFTRGSATKTISLANPRQGLTAAQVHSVMNDIIAKEAFSFTGEGTDKLDGIKRAYIRDSIITELPEA